MKPSVSQQSILLDIARETIRRELNPAAAQSASFDDPILDEPAGCFVSLHALADHRLRGCIGQLDADEKLIVVLVRSAKGVLKDPRFVDSHVRFEELPHLEIEITIIFPMQPAANVLDFEPADDGIYLTIENRSGCFLPQVARETGWGREQLLSRLCEEKLGLPADRWKNASAQLMKFKTLIVGPEPFGPQ